MNSTLRTTSEHGGFKNLVRLLDYDLKIKDGNEHAFFAQYNKIDQIKNVVVYNCGGASVGCGAFKFYDSHTAEIKRMFVLPEYRGRGIAYKILSELESWGGELGYSSYILETGKKMTEAIKLYHMKK
ncbi:MAG TPA: GNAT family N-acetyltransferase [Flavobacterium sp.]|nr:GNAT family N-acetyltransferase [Flavobacterium sp.]